MQLGGKLFNPLYYPPEEVETSDYEQSEQKMSLPLRWLSNWFTALSFSLFSPQPLPLVHKRVSISCIGWNASGTKAAVAFPDSSIRIYNFEQQEWDSVLLRHENQIGIRQICWKPDSTCCFAVASRNGIFIWSKKQGNFFVRQIDSTPNVLTISYSPNSQ